MQREFTPIVVHNRGVNVNGTGTLAFYQPENPVDFSSGNAEGVRWSLNILGTTGTADSWALRCKFQLGKWDTVGAGLSQFAWYDLQPEQINRLILEGVDWYGGLGTTTTYINEFVNPKYASSSGTGTDNAGTGGAVSATRPTAGGYQNLSYRQITWTTATTAPSGGHSTSTAALINSTGVVSGGLWVRSSVQQRLQFGIAWYNGSTLLSTSNGTAQVVPANTDIRFTLLNQTIPANANGYKLTINAVAGTNAVNWSVGDTLNVTALMGVESATLPDFFDGSYNGGAWSGTADQSTSSKTVAANPTGVVASSNDALPLSVSRAIRGFGRFVRVWLYPTAVNPSSDFTVVYSLSTE